jgi:hypothetical protein
MDGERIGKIALLGFPLHFSNSFEVSKVHSFESRKPEIPDTMPRMTSQTRYRTP